MTDFRVPLPDSRLHGSDFVWNTHARRVLAGMAACGFLVMSAGSCGSSSSPGGNLPTPGSITFSVDAGGRVSGTQTRDGAPAVSFVAEPVAEGKAKATFTVEGGGTLEVDIVDGAQGTVLIGTTPIDGFGLLTAPELAALQELATGRMFDAIAFVPLDVACAAEEIPPAVAQALLLPLQLVLKYGDLSRGTLAGQLATKSSCRFLPEDDDSRPPLRHVLMSRSALLPYVFGFFPMDEEGAAPDEGDGQESSALLPVKALIGPCNSKCRGACGPDCTLSNCTVKEEFFCQEDADGKPTGKEEQWKTYDCGIHPGCIFHDQCYDDCNAGRGCWSLRAAWCRHNTITGCDHTAAYNYGYKDGIDHVFGKGSFSGRADFPYRTEPEVLQDSALCGAGETGVHNIDMQRAYATIMEAVTDAVSGHVLRVFPGTYAETVVLDKSVTLESTGGAEATFIDGSVFIYTGGEQVELAGFTIRGGAGVILQNLNNGSPIIRENIIQNMGIGVYVESVGNGSPRIIDNIISGSATGAIIVNDGIVTIRGNTLKDNMSTLGAIFIAKEATVPGFDKTAEVQVTVGAGTPQAHVETRTVPRHAPPFEESLNTYSGNQHSNAMACAGKGLDNQVADCGADVYFAE